MQHLVLTATLYSRESPLCPVCNVRTKSKGKADFRCPSCHRRYKTPVYREINRHVSEGFYEVPVIARRHLAMPVKLSSYFYGSGIHDGVM